jgi:putative ABC transport system substrate-binding protein
MIHKTFCIPLCALLLAASVRVQAQQPNKVLRVGYLAAASASADAPRLEAFRQGLREHGYIEGQNILIDVLVAVTTKAALAAKKATGTVPIVFMGVTDPVTAGLVETLARPGGNSTGITNMAASLTGKRLELLKETIPKLRRVAVLWDPQAPGSTPQWKESQQPARELGLQLYSMQVSSADRYKAAFKEAIEARNAAVWVTLNPVANSSQRLIAELAISHRLPSICARGDYAENGCLMAYGPGYSTEGRDAARYVDKILKGAKPTEIPVEQPMKFELVFNLKTAKQIGVTIPQSVLFRADRVVK